MVKYDYHASVRDVLNCVLPDYFNEQGIIPKQWDIFELEDKLFDDLFSRDDVTGNTSGYYIHNDERIAHGRLYANLDLAADALDYFEYSTRTILPMLKDPCSLDVIIRCYVLRDCISEYLTENYEES